MKAAQDDVTIATLDSLLSPSVAETQLAGLPGKAVAKETAVH